jgi:glycosidase
MKRLGAFLLWAIMLLSPIASQESGQQWWKDAMGPAYQVLVYSFADSDGDGYGDIKGLTNALNYLNDGNPFGGKDLGISAIWLSPINVASSYHGYDVKDYKAIDPRLGTMEDFEHFVAEAHSRGIKVILDMVFNHTSREHPWFLDAMRSGASPYVAYYRTKQPGVQYGSGGMGRFYRYTRPDGSVFEYFSAFWEGMPDLNLDNTDVVNELKSILGFWIGKGVDGFRFDAAKHAFDPNEMPAGTPTLALNKSFWNDLRRYCRRIKPDIMFIGEVLTESSAEVAAYASVFDGLFDFPAARLTIDAVNRMGPGTFQTSYLNNYLQYQRISSFQPLPLLTNHDQDRIMSILLSGLGLNATAGTEPESGDNQATLTAKVLALKKAKLAAAISQTLPGLPFVYYGEELGMTGIRYQNDDISRRDGFLWTSQQGIPNTDWAKKSGKTVPGQNRLTSPLDIQLQNPESLANFYGSLSLLRAASPAIRHGSYAPVSWPGFESSSILAWLREDDAQTVLVIHNLGITSFHAAAPEGIHFQLLWASDGGLTKSAGIKAVQALDVAVPAESSAVFEVLMP